MNPYNDDADETPAQLWMQLQRQKAAERNFVTPAPLATRQPVTIDAPAWMVQQQPLDLTRALEVADGAQERTSAMDRAKALRVRLVPFLWGWVGLSVIVGAVVLMVAQNAPGAALLALLTFSGLTSVTYYRLNRTDYDYSREGTERHKVDTSAYLVERQMDNEHELRRMALDAYLQTLERNEGKR
jgi:hypothetical protein